MVMSLLLTKRENQRPVTASSRAGGRGAAMPPEYCPPGSRRRSDRRLSTALWPVSHDLFEPVDLGLDPGFLLGGLRLRERKRQEFHPAEHFDPAPGNGRP